MAVLSRRWAVALVRRLPSTFLLTVVPRAPSSGGISEEILGWVTADPGITLWELKERSGRSWGMIYHHIALLEANGLIRMTPVGRRRLVVPTSSPLTPEELEARAILRGTTARRIAELLAASPRASVPDVAAVVGESERVVYYHVKKLMEAGLVSSASRTRRTGLRPTALLHAILGR